MPFPYGLYLTECIAAGEYIISVSYSDFCYITVNLASTNITDLLSVA